MVLWRHRRFLRSEIESSRWYPDSGNDEFYKAINSKIYVDLFPCNECAKIIIQSGIKEVVYLCDKYANTDSVIASKKLFDCCGVKYRKIELSAQEIRLDL